MCPFAPQSSGQMLDLYGCQPTATARRLKPAATLEDACVPVASGGDGKEVACRLRLRGAAVRQQ